MVLQSKRTDEISDEQHWDEGRLALNEQQTISQEGPEQL